MYAKSDSIISVVTSPINHHKSIQLVQVLTRGDKKLYSNNRLFSITEALPQRIGGELKDSILCQAYDGVTIKQVLNSVTDIYNQHYHPGLS